jgi:lipid A 4'-phosphatase
LNRKNLQHPVPPYAWPAFWTGVAAILLLSLIFNLTSWDLDLASGYWNRGQNPWPGQQDAVAHALYRFGQWPALAAGIGGLLVFLFSYHSKKLRRWRGTGFFFFLLLLLGPGLLVNGFFKALAGRPRPTDVMQFGGMWPFAAPWHWGLPGKGQSFPSGHASMAFYWTGLFFVIPNRRRWLGLGAALVFAACMCWARVSQGGHFLSDTLFSGAFIFTLAALLSPLMTWQPAPEFWARKPVLAALLAGLFGYGLISQVVYEERSFAWVTSTQGLTTSPVQRLETWRGQAPLDKVALDLNLQRGDIEVAFTADDSGQALPLKVNEEFWGEGLPGAKDSLIAEALGPDPLFLQDAGTVGASVRQTLHGLWLAVTGHYSVILPSHLAVDGRLVTHDGIVTVDELPKGRQVLLNGNLRQEDLPVGFKPFGSSGWLLEGDQPQIALTLSASEVHFKE